MYYNMFFEELIYTKKLKIEMLFLSLCLRCKMPMFKKNLLPLSKPFCHSFDLASLTQDSNAIKHVFWGTNLYKKSNVFFFLVFAKGVRVQW